jgi:O-antigen/teichoic acid export membrane protein
MIRTRFKAKFLIQTYALSIVCSALTIFVLYMGIVQKDALRTMLISYIGILLGYVNKGLLFLIILTTAQIGLVNLLVTVGTLFAQFANFGTVYSTWKFFPYFKNETNKHNGFLPYILRVVGIGIVSCTLLYLLFKPEVIALYSERSAAFNDYYYMVLPIGISTVLYLVAETYLRALYKNTVAVFALEIGLRVAHTILLFLLYFRCINFHWFAVLQSFSFLIPVVILTIYLWRIGELNLSWKSILISNRFKKIIRNFSLINYVNTLGIVFVQALDVMMIAYYLGLEATGVYTTVVFLATALQVPYKSVLRVSSPLVADHWKRREMSKIQVLYTKVSTLGLVLGLTPFLVIWLNVDFLFGFLKPEFQAGIMVFFFLMLGRLLDMFFGINGAIFVTSKKYKYDVIFTVLLIGIVYALNTLLIPTWGIAGAAISTSFALIVYNIGRLLFVWKVYRLQPFHLNQFKIMGFAALAFAVGTGLHALVALNEWLFFGLELSVVALVFVVPVLWFRLDPEINNYLHKIAVKLGLAK